MSSPEVLPIEVDGSPLAVHCRANPVVAVWNEDGLWESVVSSGIGSVGWYEFIGTRKGGELGVVLASTTADPATYTFQGDELYVRSPTHELIAPGLLGKKRVQVRNRESGLLPRQWSSNDHRRDREDDQREQVDGARKGVS